LNVLYNNAAIVVFKPLIESLEEDFTKVIDVNLKGIWLGMKHAIPEIVKAGGGSIINVASIAADKAQLGLSLYAASKGGVISISRVAAMEHAAHNIRVNCIKPGPTMTPMFREKIKHDPEILRRNEKETPLGKMAQPEEIVQLAIFLASDESSHITGTAITIDGGVEADNRRIA
jgi:cyclopentanol dehydrogenase